jgi:hypothetical protein
MLELDLTAFAVEDTHHNRFTGPARARDLCLLVLVHVSGEAADKRFVCLKLTSHFLECSCPHRKSDAMEHKPCGFLRDTQVACYLVAAHAILAIHNQPSRREPFVEADRRILEDGSNLHAELALGMFALALPDASPGEKADFGAAARRAFYAIRPT